MELLKNSNPFHRPAGVTAIALLFLAAAMACVATAAFTSAGAWPLAWGRWLAGDLVTMGPALFGVAAVFYAVTGAGLLWTKNWARRMAIVIAAVGLYFLLPATSSAVYDLRIGAIAINGVQIIVRVLVLWYLFQESAGEAFRA